LLYKNFLLILIIISCASFIQGSVGFGFSLISVPLLSSFFSPIQAVGINSIVASVNSIIIFYLLRKDIQYKKTIPYIVTAYASIPLGIIFLKYLNKTVIMVSLGISVVILTLFSIFLINTKTMKFFKSKIFGYIASFASGFLGGAFTTPGPPMIAYFYNVDDSKMQAKANIQFYFFALDLLIIPAFSYTGIINTKIALNSFILLPAVIIFSKTGVIFSKKIPPKLFGSIVNVFLIALGLYILIKYSIP